MVNRNADGEVILRWTWLDRLWLVMPLLILAAFAMPLLGYLLPGYESELGENYQPLRALKFYASLGGESHKYGPMPNFLLLPLYGGSIAYWWVTGAFTGPSGDFPYGLVDPKAQLSWLIFAGRLQFLLLGLALYSGLLVSLRRVGFGRIVVAVAFASCMGTNYAAAYFLANTRPDGPAYAFIAASLGVYVLVLEYGATLRRGVLLSFLAVCAISSKELAGPVYVLPYLGLGWMLLRQVQAAPERGAESRKIALASVATGVATYLALNVVYAPRVWWGRIAHWLTGEGTSKEVWVEGGSAVIDSGARLTALLEGFLDTLGPGGIGLVAITLVALVVLRPRHAWMYSLPFISVVALGLWPLGFPGDRFYTFAAVTLVPPVALGLSALAERIQSRPARAVAGVGVSLALLVNAWFANWAWIKLEGLPERVIERVLVEEQPRFEGSLNLLAVYPAVAGKSRLVDLGFKQDPRSIAELIAADPAARPDRIYIDSGSLEFIEHAAESEARAALLRAQGFEIADWQGVEGLGYSLLRVERTELPGWFPFDFMPAVRWREQRSPVFIYERKAP